MSRSVGLQSWTPAQVAALAFGLWWISNGLAVFLVEPSGATLSTRSAVDLGSLSIAVNGWHGVFHLVTGLIGVSVCSRPDAARIFALSMAIVYLAAALTTLFTGSTVFGLIYVDDLGSVDHAIEGVLFALVWITCRNDR